MGVYRVTFDRIGRNHFPPPLVARVDDAVFAALIEGDGLASEILKHARKNGLVSNEVEVRCDFTAGTGVILAGGRNGGTFTFVEGQETAG